MQMGYGHAGDVEDIVNQAQAEVGVADKRAAEDYVIIGDILEDYRRRDRARCRLHRRDARRPHRLHRAGFFDPTVCTPDR